MSGLAKVDAAGPLSTQLGSDDEFDALAKGFDRPGWLRLYSSGKAVKRGLIPPGHFGIQQTKDEITDLGDTIDLMVYSRRTKAVDSTDKANMVVNYNATSPTFQAIKERADAKIGECMYGVSFLVWERSTARLYEFFYSSPSMRPEAKTLYPFMALSQADLDSKAAAGKDVTGITPHDALPVTLKVRLIDTPKFSWHIPIALKCSSPFAKLPELEALKAARHKFCNPVGDEAAEEAPAGRAR